ncbi:CHAT domain-containing tetratricopeptide repeat protein [Micromonospora sp. NPDC003197]
MSGVPDRDGIDLLVTFDGVDRITLTDGARSAEAEFRTPYTDERAETLRWLLEECAPLPFGPERQRYLTALNDSEQLGYELCRALTDSAGLTEIFEDFVRTVDDARSVHLISEDPQFLAIPWELLRIPGTDTYPLASARDLTRCVRLTHQDKSAPAHTGPLRVLLVSPRPYGAQDVRARTIRGPMLKVAARSVGSVHVDLLHPPTMERLREVLATTPDYSIVHFDGHGFFRADSTPAELASGLVFERADGRPDRVSAADFAAVVPVEQTPVVVLNACRSAHRSTDPNLRTVASALLAAGVPAVLAMTHNVPAAVASRFMAAFYRALGNRQTIGAAASAGRRALLDQIRHPSTTLGRTRPFQVMPVLYTQAVSTTPVLDVPVPPGEPVLDEEFDDLDMLMYRDDEVTHLDRQLRSPAPVVVHGPVALGKSVFLRSYARYAELVHTFERVELVTGAELASMTGRLRNAALAAERSQVLHIWDGMDEHLPACEEALHLLPRGHRVIIGLRHDTLGAAHHSYSLQDVPPEVTGMLLRRAIVDHGGEQQLQSVTAPLLRWLIRCTGWHGGSVQAVLRALATHSVEQVCRQMEFGLPAEAEGEGEGEGFAGTVSPPHPSDPLYDESVARCLDTLPESSLRPLSLLGLHGAVVLPRLLAVLTNKGLTEDPYTQATGMVVPAAQWRKLLAEAAQAGLVRQLAADPDVGFEVAPVVRYALRATLRRWFTPAQVAALSRGVSASAMVLLANTPGRGTAAGQGRGAYADRQTRDLTVNLLESTTLLSLWHAVRTGAYELASSVAQAFADEPVGSFGWKRARSLLDDFHQLAFAEYATRPGADVIFNMLDAILGHAAMVRDDWATARVHIDRLLQDEQTPFMRRNLVTMRLHQVTILLALGEPPAAAQALRVAVGHAVASATADALTACRIEFARLVETLALSEPQAAALAVEVGLPPAETVTPARNWDVTETDELAAQLRTAELRGDFESSVNIRRYLGRRARLGGDLDGARRWLAAALDVDQGEGQLGRTSLAETAHELSMVEEQSGNYDDAAHWCAYVIETADLSSRLYADAHHELGIVELCQGRLAESRTAFETALGIYQARSMPVYAAETSFMIAYVISESGDVPEALQRCARLLDEFTAAESWSNVVRVSLFLAQTYGERGDRRQAMAYVETARTLLPRLAPGERAEAGAALDQIEVSVDAQP